MGVFDVVISIFLIVIGAIGGVSSFVQKSRRGRSKFAAFVVSILFLVGGIVCLVFGLPAAEYIS